MQLAHSYWGCANAGPSILCLFLPCAVGTHQTLAKTNFRPHTLNHSLENIAVQYSLDVRSGQFSLVLMLHLHQLDEISRPGKSLASTLFWGLTLTFVFFFYRSPITAHSLPALSLSLSQSPQHTLVFWCLRPHWLSSLALVWLVLPLASVWLSCSVLDSG